MSHGGRAVVMGGSIAGICAAGVLARHVDEVIVVERDVLPDGAEHRRGVPQSRHPHFLLNSGRRAMDTIFPGFERALVQAGGMQLMPSMAAAHCEGRGWIPRQESTMTMIYSSRLLVERVLRDMLRDIPNVTVEEGVGVSGLETADGADGRRVTGVRLSGRPGGPDGNVVEADLIVDALGRGSRVSEWLHRAGWPQVPVRTLDAGATYSTRWYQKPTGASRPDWWWWHHLSVLPTTDTGEHPAVDDYLCQIFPIEKDRVLVTMGSWGHKMPLREDDFVDAAHAVRAPTFGAAVDVCEPISKVFVTKSTGNAWRRYDLLDAPPTGLVVIGDAICGFNPLYGQGMSSAARSALLLDEKLTARTTLDRDFFTDFYRAQAKSVKVPWTLALARDQGYDSAEGTEVVPPWRRRIVGRLAWPVFNLISGTTREDSVVEDHFAKVFNLDEPAVQMVRSPRVLAGLAWYWCKRATGRTVLPPGFDPTGHPPADVWVDGRATPGRNAEVIPLPDAAGLTAGR